MADGTDIVRLCAQQQNVGRLTIGVPQLVGHVDVPGVPAKGLRITRAADGSAKVEEYTKDIARRDHAAASLAGFTDLVKHFAAPLMDEVAEGELRSESIESEFAGPVEVWVDREAVTATLDGGGRRKNSVTLGLDYTEQFMRLVALANVTGPTAWLSQKETIELLRDQLCGLYSPADAVQNLRSLSFTNNSSATGQVQAGRESLGRSIQSELSGWKDEWETLTVTVPVYDNVAHADGLPIVATVTCTVSVDFSGQKFRIKPRAGEMDRVYREAGMVVINQVREATKDLAVAVFHGSREND